jgi:hypothetical protein
VLIFSILSTFRVDSWAWIMRKSPLPLLKLEHINICASVHLFFTRRSLISRVVSDYNTNHFQTLDASSYIVASLFILG